MNRRTVYLILFLFLLAFFSSIMIQGAFSSNYMEIEDEWYADDYLDQHNGDIVDYYNNVYPNQVNITFNEDGSFSVDVHHGDNLRDLSDPLAQCIYRQSNDSNANITTLMEELTQICKAQGLDNPNITISTPYGEDNFIFASKCVGISMEPTLHEGAITILNKTHDVHVGDIVLANYDKNKYGKICKRVAKIDGDRLYLVSDNVNGTFEKNGKTYEYEGIRTWVDISDIQGVVIDVYNNDGVIRI